MSKTISYSEARENLKTYLDYVTQNSDPIIITRKNGEDAIIMAKSDYDSINETLYLLSSENNRKHLMKAMKELESNEYKKYKKYSVADLKKLKK